MNPPANIRMTRILSKKGQKEIRRYWKKGRKFHREDGPAYIQYYTTGTKRREDWLVNGKWHRLDGPCQTRYSKDGSIRSQVWGLYGIILSENTHRRIAAMETLPRLVELIGITKDRRLLQLIAELDKNVAKNIRASLKLV